mmetsp:Transcript_27617/g.78129  ORF Transcript_27617/g.78129 Transcript_27617/m.78129 type:complete len:216 (-) Transcript_27617:1827-2474(-)
MVCLYHDTSCPQQYCPRYMRLRIFSGCRPACAKVVTRLSPSNETGGDLTISMLHARNHLLVEEYIRRTSAMPWWLLPIARTVSESCRMEAYTSLGELRCCWASSCMDKKLCCVPSSTPSSSCDPLIEPAFPSAVTALGMKNLVTAARQRPAMDSSPAFHRYLQTSSSVRGLSGGGEATPFGCLEIQYLTLSSVVTMLKIRFRFTPFASMRAVSGV